MTPFQIFISRTKKRLAAVALLPVVALAIVWRRTVVRNLTVVAVTGSVGKTTAKECKERDYKASCPMAAIAAGVSSDNPKLQAAIREAFASWEREIAAAAEGRGMSKKNAEGFASSFLAAMEGAFVVSKAQGNSTAHMNAARAMQALAAALLTVAVAA